MTTVFLLLNQSTFLIGCLTIHHKLAVRDGEKPSSGVLQVTSEGGGREIQAGPNTLYLNQQNPENGPVPIPNKASGNNQLKILAQNGVKTTEACTATDDVSIRSIALEKNVSVFDTFKNPG